MSKYNKEYLEPLIKKSKNFTELAVLCNIKPSTGSHTHLIKRVKELKLDTSHFISSHFGKIFLDRRTDVEIYLNDIKRINSHKLRVKLIESGKKFDYCEICKIKEWNSYPAPLQLHHKDGNKLNNHIENLQILCANCHCQTDNYGSKNIQKKK